jgi:hypothetical protein
MPCAAAPDGVVVFDLDSTLFDNRPRQARILREFGAAQGIELLRAVRPEHWTSWSITAAMHAAGLPQEEAVRLAHPARAFWRERFFTSDYCHDDVPVAGAPAYVAGVAGCGVRVAYVTGRHLGMEPGTLASLARHGFPAPDGARVLAWLKPTFDQSDDDWKRQACARLRDLRPVVAVFDNEPAHVNIYASAFPEALVVHLGTDHSGRPIAVAPGVPVIADFTAVPVERAAP